MSKPKLNRFWTTAITLVAIYVFVKWGIPAASREITGMPFPLPVPTTLIFFYMTLTLVALFLLVTFSDEFLDEFMAPVKKLLRGGYGKAVRTAVLVAIPLIAGWQTYDYLVPRAEMAVSLRIQHPSSNFPKAYEDRQNPYAAPSDEMVKAFIEEAKSGEVTFIAQLDEDISYWMDETGPDHMLEFIATPPMIKFLGALKSGEPDMETAKAALVEKHLVEGRTLYAMNCRPCHGDSVAGDGPMADGFKLRPINFTDNGTLETIVEGYTFWRVENGGVGLPLEATPWDSAMPEWKVSLTEEERWKIIMAEYNLAEKTPRMPEKH